MSRSTKKQHRQRSSRTDQNRTNRNQTNRNRANRTQTKRTSSSRQTTKPVTRFGSGLAAGVFAVFALIVIVISLFVSGVFSGDGSAAAGDSVATPIVVSDWLG